MMQLKIWPATFRTGLICNVGSWAWVALAPVVFTLVAVALAVTQNRAVDTAQLLAGGQKLWPVYADGGGGIPPA